MSEEMTVQTVQSQRPSAMPYVLGGGIVGAAAGHPALAGRWGLQIPRYDSWEKILEEKKDVFDSQIKSTEKNAEINKVWQDAQGFAEKINAELDECAKAMKEKLPEKLREEEAAKTYLRDITSYEAKKNFIIDEIAAGIKNGTVAEIPEADREAAKKLNGTELINKAKEIFNADGSKYAEKAKVEKEAVEKSYSVLKDKAADMKVDLPGNLNDDVQNIIKESSEKVSKIKTEAKAVLEEGVKKLKIGSKWNMAIGAAILAIVGLMLRPKAKESV